MTKLPIQILASDPNDFRDMLPTSGVFDMMDCNVNVETNLDVPIKEIERYLTILKACVNVVDIEFSSSVVSELNENELLFTVYEIPVHVAENRPPIQKPGASKLPQVKRAKVKPVQEDEDFLDI